MTTRLKLDPAPLLEFLKTHPGAVHQQAAAKLRKGAWDDGIPWLTADEWLTDGGYHLSYVYPELYS